MKLTFLKTIFLLCLSFTLLTGCTEKEDKIVLLDYGIVSTTIYKTEQDLSAVAGSRDTIDDDWKLVESTTTIPNKIGVEFGFSYERSAPFYYDSINLAQVLIFPGKGLTNPETGETQKEDIEIVSMEPGDSGYFFYGFDYPWEVKQGEWTFQLRQDGKVVLEKTFQVVEQ